MPDRGGKQREEEWSDVDATSLPGKGERREREHGARQAEAWVREYVAEGSKPKVRPQAVPKPRPYTPEPTTKVPHSPKRTTNFPRQSRPFTPESPERERIKEWNRQVRNPWAFGNVDVRQEDKQPTTGARESKGKERAHSPTRRQRDPSPHPYPPGTSPFDSKRRSFHFEAVPSSHDDWHKHGKEWKWDEESLRRFEAKHVLVFDSTTGEPSTHLNPEPVKRAATAGPAQASAQPFNEARHGPNGIGKDEKGIPLYETRDVPLHTGSRREPESSSKRPGHDRTLPKSTVTGRKRESKERPWPEPQRLKEERRRNARHDNDTRQPGSGPRRDRDHAAKPEKKERGGPSALKHEHQPGPSSPTQERQDPHPHGPSSPRKERYRSPPPPPPRHKGRTPPPASPTSPQRNRHDLPRRERERDPRPAAPASPRRNRHSSPRRERNRTSPLATPASPISPRRNRRNSPTRERETTPPPASPLIPPRVRERTTTTTYYIKSRRKKRRSSMLERLGIK